MGEGKPQLIDVDFRPGGPADVNYLLDSWLKSYASFAFASARFPRCKCPQCNAPIEHDRRDQPAPSVPPEVYFAEHTKLVRRLLSNLGALIACNPDEPDQIYGWVCVDQAGALHYAYVKRAFRRLGIATSLLEATLGHLGRPVDYSHRTYATRFLRRWLGAYNPYKAFPPLEIAK